MNLKQLQSDPAAFREVLSIDTDRGSVPFSEVVDPWQRADFEALDDGWKRAVLGSKQKAKYQRGWLERPRGHSKTLDLGVMSSWALFASRRRLSGIAAAGDLDQARLLRDAIGRLVYCNPWLGRFLEIQNTRIINPNTQSSLDIITSDAPTSYGLTPDFVICDEIVHWKKRDLWDSLLSSSAKRSTCMLVLITNAGMSGDWQWTLREAIRKDDSWFFSRLEGPQASWITEDRLQEQERLLPGIAYRRLWLNEWTTGGGDALTPEDIAAAFLPDLKPTPKAARGYEYVAGLDLGITRDASAICILGIRRGRESHGRIRLAYTKVWLPTKGSKVNLQTIENTLRELHTLFKFQQLNYDPWEARHMASRLQSTGLGKLVTGRDRRRTSLPMVEVTPSGQNLQRIASCVIEAFNDRRLELYEDANLRRDLNRLRVEERSYGFRLVSPRDQHGHGDLGTAFGLAMLGATEIAARRIVQIRVGLDGTEDETPGSAFANAWADFEERRRRFDEEQEELANQPDDPHEGFAEAFKEQVYGQH